MPKSITGDQLRNNLLLYSNIEKKDADLKINPQIVSSSEIKEYFDISKSDMMTNMYYRMLESCNSSHHGIMQKPEHSAMCDFFQLIQNSVDVRSYYKQKFKL